MHGRLSYSRAAPAEAGTRPPHHGVGRAPSIPSPPDTTHNAPSHLSQPSRKQRKSRGSCRVCADSLGVCHHPIAAILAGYPLMLASSAFPPDYSILPFRAWQVRHPQGIWTGSVVKILGLVADRKTHGVRFDDKGCQSIAITVFEHELERPPFNAFIIGVQLATLLCFLKSFIRTSQSSMTCRGGRA
jgi:hypothetical protein